MAKQPKKSAKPKKKVAKSKPAASTKKAKKPTAAKKPAKAAKPKAGKTTAKAKKTPKKPTKPTTGVKPLLSGGPPSGGGLMMMGGGGGDATPQITSPAANANITAGANLQVNVNTNRADLRYILTVSDVTPQPPPPAPPLPPVMPVNLNATPTGNDFSFNVAGTTFVAGHNYRLRVFVDPQDGGTPPHSEHVINVNA